jgi:N-acetylglucosamine malate deacetylase 1
MAKKKVLVVAAHPDDEVLGCGGSIAKHIKQKDSVHVAILAEGITSRNNNQENQQLTELKDSAQKAHAILGTTSLYLHNFPDNKMDSLPRLEVIKKVEELIKKHNPEIVYTHHSGDVNIDHRILHEAVITACRPTPENNVKQILFFEIASSTEWQTPYSAPAFIPNWFTDISETLNLKLKALKEYNSEMREFPHARSIKAIEHLAAWRGATIGVHAAEAFMLGRKIN